MLSRRNTLGRTCALAVAFFCSALTIPAVSHAEVSLGGFIPFVGIGLTEEFDTLDTDPALYNFADSQSSPSGSFLGNHFDIALLDTGAATHIITNEAYDAFDLEGADLDGINIQPIGGATGVVNLQINNPLGFYATGLGDRTASGSSLDLDTNTLQGQSSVAILSAPTSWTLPNIVGLPMAAQHGITIRNDLPQVFSHDFEGESRTVRTPQVNFTDLGLGGTNAGPGGTDIIRRADLTLNTGIGFIQGPFYVPNLDLGPDFELNFHRNPQSPTVIENGGLFIETDLDNGNGDSVEDKRFLFDTGADLTVISERTAARLGFDPLLDTPDFVLEVEGSGGVSSGIPGFYVQELKLDTVGGSFVMENVPVAVLDVTDPSDPGNIIDGILGMHVFNGRNLAIDANPSIGAGGAGPSLYISDKVTTEFHWGNQGSSGNWDTNGEWEQLTAPGELADVQAIAIGANRTANVVNNSQVYRATIGGEGSANMLVSIASNKTLITYGETKIDEGGELRINEGKLDAQFVNIEEGGILSGVGDIFVGTASISSPVRNAGRIEVGLGNSSLADVGTLSIVGDVSSLESGVMAFDLGGTIAGSQHDQLLTDRFAFLAGGLEVDLVTGFAPQVGNQFTLLVADEGITGTFGQLTLPAGYLWDVQYTSTSLILEVTGLGLQGDFNSDGSVDAADYTVWRDGLGTTYTQADYQIWVNNYGNSTPATATGVPEPVAMLLVIMASGIMGCRCERRLVS